MESASIRTGSSVESSRRYFRKPSTRVLLREPEVCAECNRVFVSLYPIRSCADHQGLDEI